MSNLEPTQRDDFPAPSHETVLLRVMVCAYLAGLPKREAERYLRRIAEALASEESLLSISLLRPPPEQAEVNKARRQAIAVFRRYLPLFLACLEELEDL
jgi:hypothetical protein